MTAVQRSPSLARWIAALGMSSLTVALAGSFASGAEPSRPQPVPLRLALLVGIQHYPNLPADRQLSGGRNDVEVMRTLLVERFGFQPSDTTTLLDQQATSSSIRGQWRRLIERIQSLPAAASPAQVVFYFSGHGSQVPDQAEGDRDCDEEDGLDQSLVCYDSTQEGSAQDIRDDELNSFVHSICKTGRARAWVILDCCHSGTGVRGVTNVRQLSRQLTPTPPQSGPKRRVTPKLLPPEAVLLAACRACEVEPEYRDGDRTYGLLTRAIGQMLQSAPAISTVSYETLRRMVVECYLREGVMPAPTPQLEGAPQMLRSIVLGAGPHADRKPFWKARCVGPERGIVRLEAGAFHGVAVGSLYELYPRLEDVPGNATRPDAPGSLAWIEIEQVDRTAATGRVFRWADPRQGSKLPLDLPAAFRAGFVVERYHQHGDLGVRVRVVRTSRAAGDGPALGPDSPSLPQALRTALTSAREPGESDWLAWVRDGGPCDLLLRFDGEYAALFPAMGMTTARAKSSTTRGDAVPDSLRGGWGPILLRDAQAAASQLTEYLRRFVRARNLIRAAATEAGGDSKAFHLELLWVQLNSNGAIEDTRPWPSDAEQSIRVRRDDLFALRVSHAQTAGQPLYVSVLAVDPEMEIQAVLPLQGTIGSDEEQRLDAGASRVSHAYKCTEPYGPHWIIALATPQPNDFYMLAQPGLPRLRSGVGRSALAEWLEDQMSLRTRAGRRPRPTSSSEAGVSAAVLNWEATP